MIKKKRSDLWNAILFQDKFYSRENKKYDLTIGLKLSFNNFLVSFDLYENVRNVLYNRTNIVIILL